MENLHLKNLTNKIPNVTDLYLDYYQKLSDMHTKVIEFASKTRMRNNELEHFKHQFLHYFNHERYSCVYGERSFEDFTKIINELSDATIGTDISQTTIYSYDRQGYNPIPYTFTFEKRDYTDYGTIESLKEKLLFLHIYTKDGIIDTITLETEDEEKLD
jgi:hypothetical protein